MKMDPNSCATGRSLFYRDYADISKEEASENVASGLDGSAITRTASHHFPAKLHYLLSEMEKDGLDHIASWMPHGRCFLVHDINVFLFKILCK